MPTCSFSMPLSVNSLRSISFAYESIEILATGAAAFMAIHVLLDHNVPEERIALLSLLASKPGGNSRVDHWKI